ncbi:hypothetical protein COOONC_05021 [Cooperia oncophora]
MVIQLEQAVTCRSCEYVTCTLHCDVPAIAHRCDFDTANLVIDLTRRSFTSMEKLALDANVISKWPAVCADIKTYRLPSPASPPKEIDVVAQSHGMSEDATNITSPSTAAVSKETTSSVIPALLLLLFSLALL